MPVVAPRRQTRRCRGRLRHDIPEALPPDRRARPPVDEAASSRCGVPAGPRAARALAVALAEELAALGASVALADADTHGAAVAPSLGLLDEAPGFAAACRLAGTGALTAAELDRVAATHRGGFRVLTGIGRPARWPELTAERIAGSSGCRARLGRRHDRRRRRQSRTRRRTAERRRGPTSQRRDARGAAACRPTRRGRGRRPGRARPVPARSRRGARAHHARADHGRRQQGAAQARSASTPADRCARRSNGSEA